jgi:hypothetical protein
MNRLINIDNFIKIFSYSKYRTKLDMIILSFFGLDSNITSYNKDTGNDTTIEFFAFIDKQFIFKIVIVDKNRFFKESKKFYLNFSFENSNVSYSMPYPYYFEFYCYYKNNHKPITLFANLLSCTNIKDIKKILNKLKVFNYQEMNDIINIINNNN